MKIEHLPLQQTLNAQAGYAADPSRPADAAQRANASEYAAGASSIDHAALSEQARLLSKARQALEETPDTRADKVATLRQQVQDGTYQVPLEKLASLLVQQLSKTEE